MTVDAERVALQIQMQREKEDEEAKQERRRKELQAEIDKERAEKSEAERIRKLSDKEAMRKERAEERKREQEKESEAKRQKKIRGVERELESSRIKQEDAEKTAMFKEMQKRNIAKKPETPRTEITAKSVKEAIKRGASKAPSYADKAVVGTFSGISQSLVGPSKSPGFKQVFRGESRELSRAVHPTKHLLTGGKVRAVPVVHSSSAIIPNPNFMGTLLGTTPVKKTKGSYDPLANFVRRL